MDIRFNHVKRIASDEAIDLNNSILVIGRASNSNLSGEIVKAKNIDELYETFGNSELTKAAEYILNENIPEVYLYNCYETENYITIADKLVHYEFSYIVPIGINISDSFYNPVTRKTMLYADLYLSGLSQDTCSTVIMTDRHAELYEDLDHYMMSMENLLKDIKTEISISSTTQDSINKWTNLVFVCNMLANVEYSSIILACQLIKTTPGSYPISTDQKAVFDYDSFDIGYNDICYFKNKVLSSEGNFENLLNLRIQNDAYKSVTVDAVVKHIRRNLDLSEHSGKFFTRYTKIQINNKVKSFMNGLLDTMIKNYNIKSIDFVLTGPNVGNVLIETEITPRGTFETLQINLEV